MNDSQSIVYYTKYTYSFLSPLLSSLWWMDIPLCPIHHFYYQFKYFRDSTTIIIVVIVLHSLRTAWVIIWLLHFSGYGSWTKGYCSFIPFKATYYYSQKAGSKLAKHFKRPCKLTCDWLLITDLQGTTLNSLMEKQFHLKKL